MPSMVPRRRTRAGLARAGLARAGLARAGLARARDQAELRWNLHRDLTPPAARNFASFGRGSRILPPVRISLPGCIEVGEHVVVLEGSWLSVVRAHETIRPRLVLGNRVRLGRGASIACIGEVLLEDDVATSDDIFIGDCYHDYTDPATPVLFQPMSIPQAVRIGAGAYLGAGSCVLPGVTVGAGAYIGESAVVTEDVPAGAVVYGNPARQLAAP